jgi:hypothetical protein
MRRALKVTVWVAVFAACGGIGAFIASRTNPFPPGVQDPGARSLTPTPTPTEVPPAGVTWDGHVVATTSHVLHVGGSCDTSWRVDLRFLVNDFGEVTGTGVAHLKGRLRCDFATAQVQSHTLRLRVTGRHANGQIALRLHVRVRAPTGSDDFGGLIHTLRAFPTLKVNDGTMGGAHHVQVSDGDQGQYVATYQVVLGCKDCAKSP